MHREWFREWFRDYGFDPGSTSSGGLAHERCFDESDEGRKEE
jgi:hypothetical protein